MKQLLILLLVAPLATIGQKTDIQLPIDTSTGKISFTGVVQVNNTKKETLFDRLRTLITSTSLIKEKNITVSDINTEEITAACKNPLILMDGSKPVSFCNITYSISLYLKDNKFKYSIRNFVHEGCVRGDGLNDMKSIGALENIITVDPGDRRYYDNVLRITKDQALKIADQLKTAAVKNEKDF